MTRILIDGDASPVKRDVIEIAGQYQLPVVIVTSIDHYTTQPYPEYVQLVYVERGADQADFKIVSLVQAGDLVITQDYGLASLLLSKATVMHHQGWYYTQDNIEALLIQRHLGQQMRQAGKRTKGPKSFDTGQRQQFRQALVDYLETNVHII